MSIEASSPTGTLTAAVVQDAITGRVLMLGYMDEEALARTRSTGEVHFWSRSRKRLWKKGETSGHVLRVVEIARDCDGDALLVRARPAGPTCHTGATSCFGAAGPTPPPSELFALEATLAARRALPPGSRSYARQLFDGGPKAIGGKLTEEAGELAAELPAGSRERVVAEAADLLFHLMVALTDREVGVADVLAELHRRAGTSGLDEKAARPR
jgi:phosphoribosyl-ATP pyrophosphohydrolase/phosphoribosyl-AMP cyclohydrolase